MKRSLGTTAVVIVILTVCATVGDGLSRWLTDGDKVSCVESAFTFGCSTTLGWILSGIGACAFVGLACLWERYRGD